MIFLQLFYEFFKVGLFAVGGGLATLPFLKAIAQKYPWFTMSDLMDMIAVSESTPGPIAINCATYAGYRAAGFWGALAATVGVMFSIMGILVVLLIKSLVDRIGSDVEY